MKEFEITFKIRNNLLLQRRQELGMTAVQMAEAIGISYGAYIEYEGLRLKPLKHNGQWKPTALKIAEFFYVMPDDLWPEAVKAIHKNKVSMRFSTEDMGMLLGDSTIRAALPPDVLFEEKEDSIIVRDAIEELQAQDREVIKRHYGFGCDIETLKTIGERFNVQQARAFQIERRAIRKLRGLASMATFKPAKRPDLSPSVFCPYCGKRAVLVDSSEVYGGVSYGPIYLCRPCQAWVGVHRGTHRPLGRLANKELRQWKQAAHAVFDPLWKGKMRRDGCSKSAARGAGYLWLAKQLRISYDECHIGMFDVGTCKRVVEVCQSIARDKEDERIARARDMEYEIQSEAK